jgi:hypothetical protein
VEEVYQLLAKQPLSREWKKDSIYLFYENSQCQKKKVLAAWFSERFELSLEKKNAFISMFPNASDITFLPNSSIQVKVTSTAFVGRKLSMLESGGPSTLFHNENGVSHWKMYCLPLSVFMLVVHHLLATSYCSERRSIVSL